MSVLSAPLSPEEQDKLYMHLVPEIEEAFQEGYDENVLKYHVWAHGLSVYDRAETFRAPLRALGLPNIPGKFMTHIDSKGHDFRFKKFFDLEKSGNNPYDSPEELTVVEGRELLTSMGIDEFTIGEFEDNVWGTKVGTRCNTWGRFTLCAADLNGTGEDYDTVMKRDTENLRVEKENLTGSSVDPAKFAVGSLVLLTRYHFENLLIPQFLLRSSLIRDLYAKQHFNLKKLGGEAALAAGAVGEEAVNEFLRKLGGHMTRLCPLKKNI